MIEGRNRVNLNDYPFVRAVEIMALARPFFRGKPILQPFMKALQGQFKLCESYHFVAEYST